MSQPSNIQERVAALEAQVSAMSSAFTQAVARLTAVEELVATAGPRFAALEDAARGFDSRVNALEGAVAGGGEAIAALTARVAGLEAAAASISGRLDTIGQVVRPGRTVMRQRLDDLQASVAEILSRLPEAPPEGGGTAR